MIQGPVVVRVANGRTGTISGRPGGAGPAANWNESTPDQQPIRRVSHGEIQLGIACHHTWPGWANNVSYSVMFTDTLWTWLLSEPFSRVVTSRSVTLSSATQSARSQGSP